MKLEGRAVVIRQDDVDTDVLYPGAFLNITDVEQMTEHLFEGLDPSLRDQLGGDTALVVGSNFGAGSSREHVPQAMSASGIRFARRQELRADLLPQLHQPRTPRRDRPRTPSTRPRRLVARARPGRRGRDGRRPPLPAQPRSRRSCARCSRAGGLVPWMRSRSCDSATPVEFALPRSTSVNRYRYPD